jgi:hyperosmotically inducible protein
MALLAAAVAALAGCGRDNSPDPLTVLPSQTSAEARPVIAMAESTADPAPRERSPELPRAQALSDNVITAKVKANIFSDPVMTGSDVSVNTDRGVVYLTGTVQSQEQAAVAAAHAQHEDGVMRIDTLLSVNAQ